MGAVAEETKESFQGAPEEEERRLALAGTQENLGVPRPLLEQGQGRCLGLGYCLGLLWIDEHQGEAPPRLSVHPLGHVTKTFGRRRAGTDFDFDHD